MFFFFFFLIVFEMSNVRGECMYRAKETKIEQSRMCELCNCVVSPELVAPSLPPSLSLSLSPQSQQKFRFAPQTLHYTTLYYTTLHYTTTHYTTLH